jgi:hypothetical protein
MSLQAESCEDLVLALRRDPGHGLALVHERLGQQVGRLIKRTTWGLLSPEELRRAYQETLAGLCNAVQAPAFRPEGCLDTMAVLAREHGLAALRRKGLSGRASSNGLLPHLEPDLARSRIGQAWLGQMGPAERAALREAILDTLEGLSLRQRLVTWLFLDHFEELESGGDAVLAEALARVTGLVESAAEVGALWRATRAALAAGLVRRHYSLD